MTKTECAKKLDLNFRTFSRYLKPDGEFNLWQYLPTFLDWFPRLSRQWLYFEEGPMTIGQGVPLDKPVPLPLIVDAVEEMARSTTGLHADIYNYIAQNCQVTPESIATGMEGSSNQSLLVERLKEENAWLKKQFEDQKEQFKELLLTHRLFAERLPGLEKPMGKPDAGTKPVPGVHTSTKGSEG